MVNAILELEIPDPDAKPLKEIRYPAEDGNLIQEIIQKRSKIIRDKVNMSNWTPFYLKLKINSSKNEFYLF